MVLWVDGLMGLRTRARKIRFSPAFRFPVSPFPRFPDAPTPRFAFSVFLAVLLILPAHLLPQPELKFEQLTFEQGLYQSNITTLFQDSRGYLWIGTSDGLNRYDGYQFRSFRFDPLLATSISGNYIYSIYEDHQGYLWITTSGGGINLFDPGSEEFTHFRQDPDQPGSLSNDNVTQVLEDHRGHLWLSTNGGGLNRFRHEEGQFVHFKKNSSDSASLSSNFISVMHEDARGNLWIGTNGGGLNRLEAGILEALPVSAEMPDTAPALPFRHYYAAGETYHPDLLNRIDSLTRSSRALASLLHPEDYQTLFRDFTLAKPTALLVVAMGDGNAYGMTDYGWLTRLPSGRTAWEMEYDQTYHAGGASRNRLQIAVLSLPPGRYRMHYRSDQQHSYRNWTNKIPDRPELWGIQAFSLSEPEARACRAQLSRRITPNSLSHNWITAIHEDSAGNLWLGTADGLSRLNARQNGTPGEKFTNFKHDSQNPHSLNHSYIESIYRGDPADRYLWVITAAEGLNQLDRLSGKVIRYLPAADPARRNGFNLSGGKVTALLHDRRQHLWIGTENSGLNYLSLPAAGGPAEGAEPPIRYLENDPTDLQSLSHDAVTTLFEDRSGLIWIGTSRGGLNKLNHRQHKFRHYTAIPDEPQSLSHKIITAIYEDQAGVIWVGTAGGGLNRLVRQNGHPREFSYTHFRHHPDDPASLSHDFVSAIYEDKMGNLWVGTYGGGLARMENREKGVFSHFRHDPHSSNSIVGNYINTLYEDQFGQLWIGTNSGLNKLDRFTRRFTSYRHDPNNPSSLSDNQVWAIYEDSYSNGKTLWIGTRAGGINKFDRQNEQFIRYMRDFDDPASLNNPAVLSIYQDRSGNLWFGTYSGGLNKFNRESEKFTFFTERDGLANNMIYGILEDPRGHLWLSTNKGLSRFDPASLTFKNYDVYDGLQANEFNAGAYCLSRSGEMFFGGVNGMNSFFPDSIQANTYVPPLAITSFSIFGRPQQRLLSEAVFHKQPIRLSYDQNFISFEFSALDYTNPGKNRYAYKLEGFDENWIDCYDRRFISFTNLAPGEYVFRVKGTNSDGVWNEQGSGVAIIITPPFWKTWWFVSICTALLLLVTYAAHQSWVKSRLKRLLEIEQIRQQENERVRAKAAHDFHDELGHKITKISLFSEILKRSVSQGPPEISDYLTRIGDTAKSLSGGMRDFIWTLNPDKDSLQEVLVRLKDFGDDLFDKTGIDFRVSGIIPEMEHIRLSTDWRRHLTLMFKEAMTNALKHAGCNNVTLEVAIPGNRLKITLSDDGKGLPADKLNPNGRDEGYEQNVLSKASVGNGLNNIRFRARQIGGTVSFRPAEPHGTRITFSGLLPDSE